MDPFRFSQSGEYSKSAIGLGRESCSTSQIIMLVTLGSGKSPVTMWVADCYGCLNKPPWGPYTVVGGRRSGLEVSEVVLALWETLSVIGKPRQGLGSRVELLGWSNPPRHLDEVDLLWSRMNYLTMLDRFRYVRGWLTGRNRITSTTYPR